MWQYNYVAAGVYSPELFHYGVKNMEWGRRRYQYKDMSLTPLGRAHYKALASHGRKSGTVDEERRRPENHEKNVGTGTVSVKKGERIERDSSRTTANRPASHNKNVGTGTVSVKKGERIERDSSRASANRPANHNKNVGSGTVSVKKGARVSGGPVGSGSLYEKRKKKYSLGRLKSR